MICFRDRTYCDSDCTNTACSRNFTEKDREAAERWWRDLPGEPPVSFSPIHRDCPDYSPKAVS